MHDVLRWILGIIVPIFAISSMLSVGLSHSLREIIDPIRNLRMVLSVLVANFLFVPLLAVSINWLLDLAEPFKIGLVLLAMAAGAPFLITLTAAARGNMAKSAGLLALLLAATIVYMPLVAPLLLQGTRLSSASIAWSLISSMLIPLCLGIFITQLWPARARTIQKMTSRVSIVALVVLIVVTVLTHSYAIGNILGTGAISASLLMTVGALGIGYLMGGPDLDQRGIVGLATSQRNIAAASVVATQDFDHPDVLIMVILTSLIALFILFPVAWLLRKQSTKLESSEMTNGYQRSTRPIGEPQ